MKLREPYWLDDVSPILAQGQQWAVTEFGIENIRGPYHYFIPKEDLPKQLAEGGYMWPYHMSSKNWVLADDFDDIFQRALEIHQRVTA